MKKSITFLLLLSLVALLPQALLAQESENMPITDPEGVMRSIYDALNVKSVDTALSYVAEDAVLTILPPPPGTNGVFIGKKAMGEWWGYLTADNGTIEFTEFVVIGDKALWSAKTTGDDFAELGLPFVEFDGVGIVRDGLLRGHTWILTEASLAQISAAGQLMANKAVIQRYMEAWDNGDVEMLDEIYAADFANHSPPLPADREGMMQAASDENVGFPNSVWTIDQIMADRDMVAIHAHFEGIHGGEFSGIPPTGAEVNFTGTLIFRVQDGQITDRWGDAAELNLLMPLGFELVPPSTGN